MTTYIPDPEIDLVLERTLPVYTDKVWAAWTDPALLVQQTAVVAALAVGQTLIILTAGIDLSVGAITILATMLSATLASKNPPLVTKATMPRSPMRSVAHLIARM